MLRWLLFCIPVAFLTAGCAAAPNLPLPGLPRPAATPSPTPTVRTIGAPPLAASPTLTLTVRPGGTVTPTAPVPLTPTAGITRTQTALAATRTVTPTATVTRTVTATPTVTRTAPPGGTAVPAQGPGVPGGLGDVNAIISATVSYVLSNTTLTGFEVEYQTTVREYARTRVQRRGDPTSTTYAILRWNNGVWAVIAYGTSFPNARELGIPDQLLPSGPPVGTPPTPTVTAPRPPPTPTPLGAR
ncbi:MAG: hypothetical protein RMM58_15155 [Chloroflexota bacterium]|nr:hypothetical protein [Dehalococcoidia bacterium]MDW8255208.1 hypothetical protein [Chloroflexota bacterium]